MSEIVSRVKGTVKNWWVFLIIGILLIIGAFWIFKTPEQSFSGIVSFISVLILLVGVLTIFFTLSNRKELDDWGIFLAGGILDVVIGFVMLNHPEAAGKLFAIFIAFWLLFRGVYTIATSINIKKEGGNSWGWMMFFGIFIVIFALISIMKPAFAAGYVVFSLGFSILLLGVVNVFLALKLRKVKSGVGDVKDAIKSKLS